MAATSPEGSPHVISGLASDACASCHATHDAQGPMLLQQQDPLSPMCFTCHGAAGPATSVQEDWSNPLVPANDPATSAWYSHPATTPSNHESALANEFGGVLNRHTACADCHQPHLADDSRPVNSVGGWSASGAIAGASGVAVVNGAAGTAPTYTLETTSAFEYQLCFKCHSGFTELPAQDPSHPSRWALDKGIELNPANVSYHPVEAAGKNQTSAMALSLAGTSPYKLWVFETDDTVRCQNCHGASSVVDQLPEPAVNASLDNHASANRGILVAPYKDRTLNAPRALPGAELRALLRLPRGGADGGRQRRPPQRHELQLARLPHERHQRRQRRGSGGLDIDVPGDGPGNATCAECHFRTHGTALAVNGQAAGHGPRELRSQRPAHARRPRASCRPRPTTMGTCTLTCHGKPHNAYGYDYPAIPWTVTRPAPTKPPVSTGTGGFAYLPPLALPGPGGNVRPDGWARGRLARTITSGVKPRPLAATNEGSNDVSHARARPTSRAPRGGLG